MKLQPGQIVSVFKRISGSTNSTNFKVDRYKAKIITIEDNKAIIEANGKHRKVNLFNILEYGL